MTEDEQGVNSNGGNDGRSEIIEKLFAGQDVAWQQLDEMRGELAAEVFGGHGWSATPEAIGDPRTATVIDLFHAMELLDPNEPAFSWNRAGLLCDLGQYVEAAEEFLEAARRLDVGITTGFIESDEAEWSETARANASQALLLAGRLTTAAVVWQQLTDDDYREQVKARIEAAVRKPAMEQEAIQWIPHPPWRDLGA